MTVEIGSGAKRNIINYMLDENAFKLVQELATSYKLHKHFSIRCETVVLSLVKKYCLKKGWGFEFQYQTGGFVIDCLVNDKIAIEFDEPHHQRSAKQKTQDTAKDTHVRNIGLKMFRVHLDMDIIDIILYLESNT
ncbi:hypothetical protein QUF80_16180 [Desulfococcaceae bacterium HSG8]|nr:hypothetical protein [Desulfococcaceae bacterium HSG8]